MYEQLGISILRSLMKFYLLYVNHSFKYLDLNLTIFTLKNKIILYETKIILLLCRPSI